VRLTSVKASTTLLAIALAAPLLLGCTAEPAERQPPAVRSPATATTGTATTGSTTVEVPDVVGMQLPAAIRRLRGSRLHPQRFWTRDATCRGADVVLRQRPQPGRELEAGDRVVILTDGVQCRPLRRRSAVPADATHTADAFAHFARGDTARPPRTGPKVALLLGGRVVGQVPADRVEDRSSWRGCSDPRGYAAAGCPVEFLGPFISAGVNRTVLDYTPTAPKGVCLVEQPGAAYADLLELGRLVITPAREGASCASDFRYELFLDEGRLVAVNLVLTDP